MFEKRKQARLNRKNINKAEHTEYSKEICAKIVDFIKDKDTIMLYNAIDSEVDVSYISKIKNKTFLYPLVVENDIIAVKSKSFKIGSYGIKEPIGKAFDKKIDVVIVPMCAYDKNLNRLGFGKGYYDRFLSDKDCLKIGVAFSCQQTDVIIEKETDIKMDVIITEKEILEG